VNCWWRHSWSPWGRPFEFGYDAYQRRTCRRCGKTTQRRVGWCSDVAVEDDGSEVREKRSAVIDVLH
jgi:hypothetical protein